MTATLDGDAIGSTTLTVSASDLSSDATLASLSLSGVSIGAFDPDTTAYAADVAHDVTETTVTAAATDADATVASLPADADAGTPGHQVALAAGANTIRVTVTAADGTQRTYSVVVTRAAQESEETDEDYAAIEYVDTRHATGGTIPVTGGGRVFSDSFATNVPQGAQMPFGMTHLHPITNVRAEDPAAYARLPGADAGTVYTSHSPNNARRGASSTGGRERWEYYAFERARIKAFAVTAVSGTGCWGRIAKDFPFMLYPGDQSALTMDVSTPTAANRDQIDTREVRPLQVKDEDPDTHLTGEPGYFKAVFNEDRTGGHDFVAEFTTSRRAGIARFDLAAMDEDTATLFFTTMSAMKRDGSTLAVATRDGQTVVEATIHNLGFCADDWSGYKIHMVAMFSTSPDVSTPTPLSRTISWNGRETAVKLAASGEENLERVLVKYGISYVSLDAAYNNLGNEIPDWDFDAVKTRAQTAWNTHLGVVRIGDGEPEAADDRAELLDRKRVFYGGLYRASLGPNLFSDLPFDADDPDTADVDESKPFYIGFNNAVYNLEPHQEAQYQNFSGWDAYRSHSPLVAFLYRDIASDMAQSLVNNARQANCAKAARNCEKGSFTQWGIANDDANVMNGEPGAVMVANALLLGAANFDVREAFEAMQRGSTDVFGSVRHYSNNVDNRSGRFPLGHNGSPLYSHRPAEGTASKWLELASAMFAKAVFAKYLGRLAAVDGEGRDEGDYYGLASGDFGALGGAVTRLKTSARTEDATQDTYAAAAAGFFANYTESLSRFRQALGTNRANTYFGGLQEGTLGQYLWSRPVDLDGVPADHHLSIKRWYDGLASPRLSAADDGSDRTARFARAVSALDDHLALNRLNSGYRSKHLWFGNQVSHFSPWAYNFLADGSAAVDAWRTQRVVRKILIDMFNASVNGGLPGNDDVGATSAWGVWAALGLYPAVPGLPVFTLVNPAFQRIEIDKDATGVLTILSPSLDYTTDSGASDERLYQYIESIELKQGTGDFQAHAKSFIGLPELLAPADLAQDVTLRVNVATEPSGAATGEARTSAPARAATGLTKGPSISSEAALDAFLADELGIAMPALVADARLSLLALAEADIGAFDAETTSYSASVPHHVAVATVSAEVAEAGANFEISPADGDSVAPGHQVALAVGVNTITVVVTALDGTTTRTYTVAVTRAALPEAALSAVSAAVDEGAAAIFEVTLTAAQPAALTVSAVVTATGVGLSGAPPASATVAAGDTSARLTVPTADDSVVRGGGTVTATLSAGDGYTLGTPATATVVVAEDDAAEFAVAASPSELTEGSSATVTVTIANGTTFAGAQEIALAVAGVSKSDYTLDPATLTLAAGASSASATFAALDDGVAEEPETATVAASLDGAEIGRAALVLSDPAPPPRMRVEGVPQVGATLTAVTPEKDPGSSGAVGASSVRPRRTVDDADVALQWLRDGAEIAGATGAFARADGGGRGRRNVGAQFARRPDAGERGDGAGVGPARQRGGGAERGGALGDDDDARLVGRLPGVGGGPRAVRAGVVRIARRRRVRARRRGLRGDPGDAERRGHPGVRDHTGAALDGRPGAALGRPPDRGPGGGDGVRRAAVVRADAAAAGRLRPLLARGVGRGAGGGVAAPRTSAGGGDAGGGRGRGGGRRDGRVRGVRGPRAARAAGGGRVGDRVGRGTVRVRAGVGDHRGRRDHCDAEPADGGRRGGVGRRVGDGALLAGDGYALGDPVEATVAVTEDDAAEFSVAASPAELLEGETATVTVAIANGTTYAADREVALAVTGDVAASDYSLPAAIDLPAGSSSATASFEALADDADEPRETARVAASVDGEEVGAATLAIRPAGTDATLADLTLSDVDIGAFDSETRAYAGESAVGIESTTVAATPADANAAVEIADAAGSTLGTERTSALATGANEIAATVTAEDGRTERTYAVTVTRPPPWGARLPDRDIELGGSGTATGVWSDGETLWVVPSWYADSLWAFDLATGARIEESDIALPTAERIYAALTGHGTTLWAAVYGEAVVEAYRLPGGARLTDDHLAEALSAAGNDNPTGLWADASTLRVADLTDKRIYAYGVADGTRSTTSEFGLATPDTQTIFPWGLWSDGATALTSWWGRGAVRAFRLSDGARQPQFDIDTGASGNADPQGLWSDGDTLWVLDGTDRKLYAYAATGLRTSGGFAGSISSRALPVPSAAPGPAVAIPDPALRGRIAAALGRPADAAVGANELLALTALDLRGAGVADLTGLERAANLAELDIGGNAVGDLRALAWLPRLATLHADATGADPWQLAGLAGLRTLSLRNNGIEDLQPLSGLAGLEVLDIGGNRVSDLGPLATLRSLRVLRADGNAIVDVAPLGALPALRTLDLRNNRIEDGASLDGLPNLRRLDLGGNPAAPDPGGRL